MNVKLYTFNFKNSFSLVYAMKNLIKTSRTRLDKAVFHF